jgi:type I restriction enzyme S subunit
MNEIKNIPEGWVETTLGEVCSKIGSGSTPKGGNEAYKESGISLVRSQNIHDFSFSYNGLAFIDDEQAKKLSSVTLESKDVLLNITGDSVARSCMIPEEVLPARVNQHVAILRAENDKINSYYLKYLLLNKTCKNHLLMIASSGATRNALTKTMIEKFDIIIPPLLEQKSIAAILTAFDNKIKLLQSQNKTLEETAQTIFAKWFGKYQIEDELPEGWRVDSLENISIEITRGFTTSYVENSNLINLNQKVNKGSFLDKQHFKYYDDNTIVPENKFIKKYDILLNSLGEGTLGRVHLYCEETDNVVADQHVSNLRFDLNFALYVYQVLISNEGQFRLLNEISGSTGMTMLNISKVRDFEIIVPEKVVLEKFQKLLIPFYEKIEINNSQIQTLTKTRDELLPRLMSGEVRVKM